MSSIYDHTLQTIEAYPYGIKYVSLKTKRMKEKKVMMKQLSNKRHKKNAS